jgi:DNA-binding GntR family transcriptional regulator
VPVHLSKTMLAVELLREKIVNGEVAPGQRFDVKRLASEFDMSITPVREALRILQADGLVSYDEHRSISAMQLSEDDAKELYLLRSTLESMAAGMAAERWLPADEDKVRQAHAQMVKAVHDGDAAAASIANRAWHFAVYNSARSHFIEPIISRLWSQFAWSTIWSVPGRLEDSLVEHELITAAYLARDPELAATLMRKHVEGGQRAVIEHGENIARGASGVV